MGFGDFSGEETLECSQWRKLAAEMSIDSAIFDRSFRCVESFGRRYIPQGDFLHNHVIDSLQTPVEDRRCVRLMSHGECVCACINPIKSSDNDVFLYFVEFFDSKQSVEILTKTDLVLRAKPIYGSIENDISKIWRLTSAIEHDPSVRADSEMRKNICEIENAVSHLGSCCTDLFELISMMSEKTSPKCLDAVDFCKMIVNRCNVILEQCGRTIELFCEPEKLCVSVDVRHALCAMANALQNALLYSPRISKPFITVCGKMSDARRFVEIRVTSDVDSISNGIMPNADSDEFLFERAGLGLPVLKQFVYESGGTISFEKSGNKQIITMSFPQIDHNNIPLLNFQADKEYYINDTAPEILEIKMLEVVRLHSR